MAKILCVIVAALAYFMLGKLKTNLISVCCGQMNKPAVFLLLLYPSFFLFFFYYGIADGHCRV